MEKHKMLEVLADSTFTLMQCGYENATASVKLQADTLKFRNE